MHYEQSGHLCRFSYFLKYFIKNGLTLFLYGYILILTNRCSVCRKAIKMSRIEKVVTLLGEYTFTRRAYGGFRDETVSIYKMTDDEGKVYVWKTTGHLMKETVLGKPEDEYREVDTYFPRKGDVFTIRATVKGEGEYKGEPQTEINRVVVKEIISKHIEKTAEKQKQSINLEEGDYIWEMPYGQYKKHYSDCETIAGSYDDERRMIKVIIRAGRLKASGTRGEHYAYFKVTNGTDVEWYKAISEENAIKRAKKEYGGEWWIEDAKYRNCRGQYW